MDQARPTSRKAIRRRSSPSKRNRPKKPQRRVWAVMPARKNTTTSVAASTGATTLAAQIAIRPTRRQHIAEQSGIKHVSYPNQRRRNRDLLAANMLRGSEPQLCISCHSETKAQFSRPFHHKVLEGLIKCSDCHNPHGGFELKQARLSTGADAGCLKCHTDKQGPFVFEHAPLKIEGCSSCHTPHGSANAKLLTRSTCGNSVSSVTATRTRLARLTLRIFITRRR